MDLATAIVTLVGQLAPLALQALQAKMSGDDQKHDAIAAAAVQATNEFTAAVNGLLGIEEQDDDDAAAAEDERFGKP
jgi:hypothetical protein